ncbi:MAG TPA: chemotaxis protein CheB [Myxococcaceae bacterium]|nr:chemotaxis protein CheB [Myxococcaceae bacterium]
MTRVLLIDGDLARRRQLMRCFRRETDFEVVAQVIAVDEAIDAARAEKPELVMLGVSRGSGSAETVRSLLTAYPVPVVLVGGKSRTSPEVVEALAAGAVEHVDLPPRQEPLAEAAFLRMVRVLSRVRIRKPPPIVPHRLLAVGCSTGGPSALRELLAGLPPDFPAPVVVAQHAARGYEAGLAEWLDQDCQLRVRVASGLQAPLPGEVLLGPAERDLIFENPMRLVARPAAPTGYHPSADLLFASVALVFREAGVAVVLSGAGADGAEGAVKVARAGGVVLAQDERSSTVYGMPRATAEAGVAAVVGTPQTLARAVLQAMGWESRPPRPGP